MVQSLRMKLTQTTLNNGLRTILVNIPDAPTVTVLTLIAAGSRREKQEEHGLAHFLEHMCFKGTASRPRAIDIARELEGLGAQSNAFTGKGYTGYYAKAAPKHALALLDVISDLYLHPTFPEEEIEKEKGVIVEEINMYDDMPKSVVDDLYNEMMYGADTAPGRTIIGTKGSVRSFKRDDFVRFRDRNYSAGSTIVVVAGSFDAAVMKKEIAKRFSGVKEGSLKNEPAYKFASGNPLAIKEKKSEQTHLILGLPSFSLHSAIDPAARVLGTVLGGGMSSRLFQRLREELGLCYYVYASNDAHDTYGDFSIGAGIPHGREADTIREVKAILEETTHTLIPKDELTIAKNYFVGNFVMGVESSDDVAFYYGMRAAHGLPMETPEKRAKAISSVPAEEVQAAAKKIFKKGALRAALVTPHADRQKLLGILSE